MANQMQYDNSDDRLKKTQPVNVKEEESEQDETDMPAMASGKVYYYTTLPNGAFDNDTEIGGEVYEESEDGIMYTPKRPVSFLQQNQPNNGG